MRNISLLLVLFFISVISFSQNYKTLGTWNNDGVPNYLEAQNDEISDDFLHRINTSVPEYQKAPIAHPEYFDNEIETNILINQTADVWVTFVAEGAGYRNVLGFYTYQKDNPPTEFSDIESSMTVIFPNVSRKNSGGGLLEGNKVKIGTFDSNTVIGWFVAADGFRNSNVTNGNWLLFSNRELNPESNNSIKQHSILLYDEEVERIVLAFEDIRRDYGSCDQDFNDAIFYVTSNPIEAVDLDDVALIENPNPLNRADLELEKTLDNDTPQDGDEINYTITLTNNGPNEATSIKVEDLIPEGLTYVEHSEDAGSYIPSTGIWTIASLQANSSTSLNIKVKVTLEDISESIFDLGAAKDFNVFVFDDFSQPSADVEGKMAVGKDAFLSSFSVGDKLTDSGGSEDVLVVGENLTFLSGTVTGGNVVYGIGTNLPDQQVSILHGSLRNDTPIDFDKEENYFKTLSTSLKAYPKTSNSVFQNSGLVLNGSEPFLNVFEVDGTELDAATSVQINVPNGSVVLVNISGTDIEWSGDLQVNGTAISNVLYNFYESLDLRIVGIDVRGSILAPNSFLDFPSGVINGQVIVRGIYGTGQFNSGDNLATHFRGNLPVSDNIVNRAEILDVDQVDTEKNNNSADVQLTLTGFHDPGNTGNVNWQQVSTVAGGELIWTMVYDDQGNLYSGTWGGKIYFSDDNGETQTRINSDMSDTYIWALLIDGTDIYAGTENGVYKTTDGGDNWDLVGLSGKDVRALAKSGGNIIAGTWGEGVYTSSNSGADWTDQSTNGMDVKILHALASDGHGNVYAGTYGGGIYKSTDNGVNWTQQELGYDFVWSLAVTQTGDVIAGTYGNGVYRTQDGGDNWFRINNNLLATHIYSITSDNSGNVFISTWTGGVYVLESGNKSSENTWGDLGMDGLGVSSITIDPAAGTIYAGTNDGILYSNASPLVSVGSVNEITPVEFNLQQNYPNPFNPSTKINFSVAEPGTYSISIYNILGEKVLSAFEGSLSQGRHTINLNTSNLTTGVYIYRLEGANISVSRKMLLIK